MKRFNRKIYIKKKAYFKGFFVFSMEFSLISTIILVIYAFINIKIKINLRPTNFARFYNISNEILSDLDKIVDFKIIEKLQNSKFSKCYLCPKMKQKSTSSPDDLAINFIYGNSITNILTWVRTLRSTGCKCKILFLVNDGFTDNFNNNELNALEDCGVVMWNIGKFGDKLNRTDLRPFRYFPLQMFLEAYGNYFKRVLINDIYDSLFQKDPFSPKLPSDKVSVSVEKVQFIFHDTNMEWVRAIDDYQTPKSFWEKKFCLNGGLMIGKPDLIIELLHYIDDPKYLLNPKTSDQGVMNYVHYKNIFNKMWVDKNAEFFSSACYSKYEIHPGEDGYMHEKVSPKLTPHIIHQFDRIQPVIYHLIKVCPRMGKWQRSPYGRLDRVVQYKNGHSTTNNVKIIPE